MDSRKFGPASPGILVKVSLPRSRFAFVPKPLPDPWEMPASLWPLLVEAREALGKLDGLGRHMPNHSLLLHPLQQREALRSSSMEGTYATPEELLLFQVEPREAESWSEKVNEWREAARSGQSPLGVNA